ncbi:hypothetical protein COCCU_10455 [Corynebacterium occultum]|uniref:Uncharacterized protein n=1 Tax=Corynebacterium occultum TaxID=2675219 RepID=A0A6B8WDD5_9CORY|nr:hypothetical protein [Corynebacterium occultum]QGU08010.1 hypothetical protein COCCU_10455 [Corynebacterium occultum]
MPRPKFLSLTALGVIAGLSLPLAPTATAVTDPTLSFNSLGLGEIADFPGRIATVELVIPVPEGTSPVVLNGQFQIPAEYSGGRIEVYAEGELLGIQELDLDRADEDDPGSVTVELPIAGVPVDQGVASIQVRSFLDPLIEDWCTWDDGLFQPQLRDATVEFFGQTRHPESVADFLPQVMEKLSIYLPAEPDEAEAAAAFEVTTAMSQRYRSQAPEIEVLALPAGSAQPSALAGDFERQIVIIAEDKPEVSVGQSGAEGVHLRLAGEDLALLDQARLLSTELLELADEENATVENLVEAPDLAPAATTVQELGNYRLAGEGLARTQVSIGLDRSRLGSFPGDLELKLQGSYTPLPEANAGQVLYRVGETILDQHPMDDSGIIDRDILIPRDLLGRFSQLDVEVLSTGTVDCGHTQPIRLRIDGTSEISTDLVDIPKSVGFLALPQALLPRVDVALADITLAEVQRTVRILNGIQSLSGSRLRPELVSWEEALAGQRPALLIDTTGQRFTELDLPVRKEGEVLKVAGGEGELRLAEKDFASLQTSWDAEGSRMIIAAGSTAAPELLDQTLNWLEAQPRRWSQLQGQALVTFAGSEPVDVLGAAQSDPGQDRSAHRWGWILGGIFLLLILVGAVVLMLRSRAQGPVPQADPQESEQRGR